MRSRRAFLNCAGQCTATLAVVAIANLDAIGQTLSGSYPAKPVRLVVPGAAGGAVDVAGRLFAKELAVQFGQSVYVDNRVGATGLIGTQAVQHAAPDGLTLLYTSSSAQVLSGLLRQPPPFDAVRDFAPISMTLRYPLYLVAHPSAHARTVPELVAYAKRNPGKLNFASIGSGSVGHMACELFAQSADIDVVHVPYKSGAAATSGLLAGEVQFMCDSVANAQSFVKEGRLIGLAVMDKARSPQVPDVPTMAELGWPGVEASVWHGLFAPAHTPASVLDRLADVLDRVKRLEAVRDRARSQGMEITLDTPQSFTQAIVAERSQWTQIVKSKGIVAE